MSAADRSERALHRLKSVLGLGGAVRSRMAAIMRRAKVPLLAALLLASLATFGAAGWSLWTKRMDNGAIAALAAGRDRPVDPLTARDPLLLARAYFLLRRDLLDEAQPLVDQANLRSAPRTRADILYAMANARMRRALALVEAGSFDKAIAFVRLAKLDYRSVLAIRPEDWNAKYNLDLAMRLVRDFPSAETSGEETPPDASKRLWTDLPGVPRGLP